MIVGETNKVLLFIMLRFILSFSSTLLIAFFPSPSHQLIQSEGRFWVTPSELLFLASRCTLDPYVFGVRYCDISVAPEGWARLMDCKDSQRFCSMIQNECPINNEIIPFPILGAEAAKSTFRWCDEFVAKLGLCPWAKQSLSRPGAVRVNIIRHASINAPAELNDYECAIRSAASDLLFVTDPVADMARNDGLGYIDSDTSSSGLETKTGSHYYAIDGPPAVDPRLAITFIVLAPSEPMNSKSSPPRTLSSSTINSFPEFYEFVNNLESTFFEEADSGLSSTGDLVTIAGFHPNWEFFGLENSPINFEKQSPYPTVSLVLTESIDEAGEEATKRIAKNNKEILNAIGSQGLSKLFQGKVLRLPS